MKITAALLGIGVAGIAAACSMRQEPRMTPAARTVSSEERAVDSLARAMCEHEERCGEIGWERAYSTRGSCLNDAASRASRHLRACAAPDQSALQKCLDSLAAQDCNASMQLGRIEACSSENLCR